MHRRTEKRVYVSFSSFYLSTFLLCLALSVSNYFVSAFIQVLIVTFDFFSVCSFVCFKTLNCWAEEVSMASKATEFDSRNIKTFFTPSAFDKFCHKNNCFYKLGEKYPMFSTHTTLIKVFSDNEFKSFYQVSVYPLEKM